MHASCDEACSGRHQCFPPPCCPATPDPTSICMYSDPRVQCRKLMIDAVMATDMAIHFDLLRSFSNHLQERPNLNDWQEQRNLLFQMVVHLADIANPSRPFPLARAWAERVVQEFCDQVRMEGREMQRWPADTAAAAISGWAQTPSVHGILRQDLSGAHGYGWQHQDKGLCLRLIRVARADCTPLVEPTHGPRCWLKLTRCYSHLLQQGDQEKAKGLPISPFCVRETMNMPKAQLNFIDVFVKVRTLDRGWGDMCGAAVCATAFSCTAVQLCGTGESAATASTVYFWGYCMGLGCRPALPSERTNTHVARMLQEQI